MAKHRVVLIEADLRRPQIGIRLGLDDAIGTTSVLIGRVSLADALQEYEATGLQVLACGPIPPNPSELLQSVAMEKLIQDLRGAVRHRRDRRPPLLPVTDAALLAAQADGATGRGPARQDHQGPARATPSSGSTRSTPRRSGVVVNMAPAKKANSAYGYGYGYGYSYASDDAAQRRVKEANAGRTSAR